jgi:NhaP-type Na+/H+ or K+/H+ antiporter
MTGAISRWTVVPTLLITCGGGVLVGYLLARLWLVVMLRVEDIPVSIILQFVGTFAMWLLADRLGLSAIITVVTFAMTLARSAPATDARHRIASYAVWEVVVFVLNVLAFVLIGLQLRTIWERTRGPNLHTYLLCAAAVCATVVVVRLVWVMWYGFVMRLMKRPSAPSVGAGLAVGWSGMRGIVTLAASLALPGDFPHRDLIILCAFCVVLATLVVQGLTLRPLMAVLGLKDDGSVAREIKLARVETARAALKAFDGEERHPAVEVLRVEYEARVTSGERSETLEETRMTQLQRRSVVLQRRHLMQMRERSVIGDDAFHAAEEELDLLELTADARIRPGP